MTEVDNIVTFCFEDILGEMVDTLNSMALGREKKEKKNKGKKVKKEENK